MSTSNRPTTHPLAWTSLSLGLLGSVVMAILLLIANLGNVGLPTRAFIVIYLPLGGLGLITGIAAVIGIVRGHRRGWTQATLGILLALLNLFIGFAALAVANLDLNFS
jgi:uncharacterized membrane protein HdeD (DUF308 family)